MYKLIPTKRFIKQLRKLDKFTQKRIATYLSSHALDDPRPYRKALSANRTGQWRYRIGDYRVICQIQNDELIILALSVGHRKDSY